MIHSTKTLKMMKYVWCIALIAFLCPLLSSAESMEDETELAQDAAQGRFLFFNTSSTANTLTLVGALILFGVIAYLIYVGGLLGEGNSSNGGYNRNSYVEDEYNNFYRSSNDAFEFNHLNILQWISLLQERLICEVMKEPTYYGTAAQKFKNGFQYAKYLEVLSLPDDMRELLDEYMDANNRADQSKECSEFFDCPYSIKDSVKRNLSGNDL
ncbi:unnamed protein product [Lepeophtheirus salmonis]|uniref:(salmon louse) hypothetical protein n=2 Tax=Lepeophtheirus salmonis TaxID=72036 RepID=A0A7R8H392_LEPSM|nr:unnamed protein product [Lepeophtheirus salmonis]CAF2842685.1 unnamed protein product [Lepeophtheirus salmonis]